MKKQKLLKQLENTILKKEIQPCSIFLIEYVLSNNNDIVGDKNRFIKKNILTLIPQLQKKLRFVILLRKFSCEKKLESFTKNCIRTNIIISKINTVYCKKQKNIALFFSQQNNFKKIIFCMLNKIFKLKILIK